MLQVSRDQLPERLRYFRTRPAVETVNAPPLTLTFPVAGSTVELPEKDGALAELPLTAKGGVRPLRWLVNSRPLAADPWRRDAWWPPDGRGLVRITVLDQSGQAASAEVWVSQAGSN